MNTKKDTVKIVISVQGKNYNLQCNRKTRDSIYQALKDKTSNQNNQK